MSYRVEVTPKKSYLVTVKDKNYNQEPTVIGVAETLGDITKIYDGFIKAVVEVNSNMKFHKKTSYKGYIELDFNTKCPYGLAEDYMTTYTVYYKDIVLNELISY